MQDWPSEPSSDRPFLAFLQTAFDPMLLVNQEGRCIAANPAACALLGWSDNDLLRQNLTTLFLTDPPLLREVNDQTVPISNQGQIRRADGRSQWVCYRISAFTSDPVRQYLVVLREEIQEDLEAQPLPATASENLTARPQGDWWFRSAFEQSIQLASLLSPDGDMLIDNQTAMDFCQLAPQDFTGRPFANLDCWQVSPEIRDRLLAAIASAANGETVRYETTIRAPDQSLVAIDFSLKPIRNRAGHIEFLLAEGLNITPQKQIEDALRQSEALFSVAFHSNPEPMIISTLEGDRLLEVNQQFCQVTGYQRDEVLGRSIPDLNLWQFAEEYQSMVVALWESARLHNYEATFCMKSGEIRVGLVSAQTVEINQQPCILSTIKDITERKQAESALQDAEARRKVIKIK